MSADETQPEELQSKPEKKPFSVKRLMWKLMKWTLLLFVIIWIALTILSNLGGNSDVLKGAMQDFISQQTGMNAKIGTFNNMNFFPDISVDMQSIVIEDPQNETKPITVGELKIAFRFFDVVLGRKSIRDVRVMDVDIPKGTLSDHAIKIERIGIVDGDEEGKAFLQGKGVIDGQALFARLDMIPKGSVSGRFFSLPKDNHLDVTIGNLKATGKFEKSLFSGVTVKDLAVYYAEKPALMGEVSYKKDGSNFDAKGQLHTADQRSEITLDISQKHNGQTKALEGSITASKLALKDLAAQSPARRAIDAIDTLLSTPKGYFDYEGQTADIKIDVQDLRAGSIKIGHFKAPLIIADNVLKLSPQGRVSNGSLSGNISLDAANKPAQLKADLMIRDFDYGALQKQTQEEAEIDGKADVNIKLSSAANTPQGLIDNLKGTANAAGGKGKMRSGLLDLWGGGLLNALLPDFEAANALNLNCVVANFEIEKGVANSKAVFVDTQNITLSGEGSYNIAKDDMDLKLTPKTKDVALVDVGPGVVLSGSLGDLSVSPSAVDLGKKIGGLLLGAINPAFLALSLTDLGLSDDHPCKAFVIEGETLAPKEEKQAPALEEKREANE